MTIEEAKKIIEMCADAVKKTDGDDAKIYVNKEYVLSVLDMVETAPSGFQPGIEPITTPSWPPTWPQVWYKTDNDGPSDPGPGFEKVPWWVWYKNGNEFTCNSTGSKPQYPDIVMTSSDLTKFAESHTNAGDVKNVTITSNSTEPTHLFKENFTTAGTVKETTDGTHTI